MSSATPNDGASARAQTESSALMGWVLLGLGLIITVLAAIVLLRAWSTKDTVGGRIGSALLAAGVCVAICGAARRAPVFAGPPRPSPSIRRVAPPR